jgi:sterol carrier protein 2
MEQSLSILLKLPLKIISTVSIIHILNSKRDLPLIKSKKPPQIHGILTKLQCCPTSDGAGCAIICNEKFMLDHGLQDQAVEIVAMELTTDVPKMFDSNIELVGYSMTRNAAEKVYEKSGVKPEEIGVV